MYSCNHTIREKPKFSNEMLLLKNVHFHWHFVKSIFFKPFAIDSFLLIKEFAVARTRKRFVKSIIELSSQRNVKNAIANQKNVENAIATETASVSLIQRQKKIFIQRDSFQFEITKNIVSKKRLAFIRGRIVDKNARARGREKGGRGRGQAKRRRGIREEKNRWVKSTKSVNQEANQITNELATE